MGNYYFLGPDEEEEIKSEDIDIDAFVKDIGGGEKTKQEIRDGIIPDPNAIDPITGEPLPDGGMMGDIPTEPDLESQGGITQVDGKSAEI